jgi:hypothetical protein
MEWIAMAEYRRSLTRTMENLPSSTPIACEAVYSRARVALLSKLRATQPSISETALAAEQHAFEAAVRRLKAHRNAGIACATSCKLRGACREKSAKPTGWLSDALARPARNRENLSPDPSRRLIDPP